MNPQLQRIPESKAAHRRKLADLPIEEKLRLRDAMSERPIAFEGATSHPDSSDLRQVGATSRITPNPRNA